MAEARRVNSIGIINSWFGNYFNEIFRIENI